MRTVAQKLIAAVPASEPYAQDIAAASVASAPMAVGIERWALVFAGIVDRESRFGNVLVPRGPAGLGDFGHGHGLGQVDDRPAKESASDYEQALSQRRLDHIASGDWTDPRKHLMFCAVEVLRGAWNQFPDLDTEARLAAAVASYNAGVDNVRRALDGNRNVDAVTTGKDYSADVLSSAAEWSTLTA